jgi:hypothetical protein
MAWGLNAVYSTSTSKIDRRTKRDVKCFYSESIDQQLESVVSLPPLLASHMRHEWGPCPIRVYRVQLCYGLANH